MVRNSLVTLAAAFTLSACGGDDPLGVNSGDPLTEAEIQVVFFAITEAFSSMDFGPAAAGPARATLPVNESFQGSAACGQGGSISANGSASGTVDDVTYELDLTYRVRMTPNSCEVETESGVIILDGAPYIQLDMDLLLTEDLIDVSGSQDGGIAFTSTDGRSGTCRFDVQFSATANLTTASGSSSTSGSVCGVSVEGLEVWNVD